MKRKLYSMNKAMAKDISKYSVYIYAKDGNTVIEIPHKVKAYADEDVERLIAKSA